MATAHQSIGYVGTNITFEAANSNPLFITLDGTSPADRCFLWVKNADAASRTVTITVPGTTFGQANADVAVTVPAGQERLIGPLDSGLTPNGLGLGPILDPFIAWAYSSATNVTIAVVDLPKPPPDLP